MHKIIQLIKYYNFSTKKAMQGNMTFQQSLTVRLNIIRPSLEQIKQFIKIHPPKLTPGIKYIFYLNKL